MKVAVIGGNGQFGSEIINNCPEEINILNVTRNNFDLTDKYQLKSFFKKNEFDYVINTAAYHEVDRCESEIKLTFETNTFPLKYMCEVLDNTNTKIVQVSTDYVFDGKIKNRKYKENDVKNPLNIYGMSKALAENIVINERSDNFIIARISSLYGKNKSKMKNNNFVYKMLELSEEKQTLKIINDMYMSPTYSYDASISLWDLILNESNGIYHLSNEGMCTWFDFAEKIFELCDIDINLIPCLTSEFPSIAKKPQYSALEDTKGLKKRKWEQGLEEFISLLNIN